MSFSSNKKVSSSAKNLMLYFFPFLASGRLIRTYPSLEVYTYNGREKAWVWFILMGLFGCSLQEAWIIRIGLGESFIFLSYQYLIQVLFCAGYPGKVFWPD